MTDYPEFEFNEEDVVSREVIPHDKASTERSLARRLALQALYEADSGTHTIGDILSHFLTPTSTLTYQDMLADYMPSSYYHSEKLRDLVETVLSEQDIEKRILSYFEMLFRRILAYSKQLDNVLQSYAPEFPIEQVAIIDRNILRIALYEIGLETQVPLSVAIDEAVDLARVFGAESTSRFVNGVLGAIADDLERVQESLKKAIETDDTGN